MKLFSLLFAGLALAKEELTGAEFKAEVAKGPVFAKFYAPWCGHCKKLAPAWTELAEEINGDAEWGATIASVDCTQHKEVCSENGVTGYPTLKFFNGGEATKYQGARTLEALRTWLDGQLPGDDDAAAGDAEPAAPAKGEVVNLNAKNFKSSIAPPEQVSFVKFFAPWCGHCKKMAPTWVDLAKDLGSDDSVMIAEVDCTVESSVCSENGVKGYPTLKAFKGGKEIEKYAGGRDINSFKAAIKKYQGGSAEPAKPAEPAKQAAAGGDAEGDVVELTADNFASTVASGAWFIKFYAPWCGHCKNLAPTWETLGKDSKAGKIAAKIAKVDCTQHNPICKENEVKGFPTLLFFQDGKNLGKHQGGRDLDSLKKSITKFLNPGAAAEEEKANEAAADDFYKKIENKHAFVKFYAPWCGHCKKLAPAWTELEGKFKDNTKTAVFDVDCTAEANKQVCSKMGVRGYPTIKYFGPGEKGEGDKYAGGRDVAALETFMNNKLAAAGSDHDEL